LARLARCGSFPSAADGRAVRRMRSTRDRGSGRTSRLAPDVDSEAVLRDERSASCGVEVFESAEEFARKRQDFAESTERCALVRGVRLKLTPAIDTNDLEPELRRVAQGKSRLGASLRSFFRNKSETSARDLDVRFRFACESMPSVPKASTFATGILQRGRAHTPPHCEESMAGVCSVLVSDSTKVWLMRGGEFVVQRRDDMVLMPPGVQHEVHTYPAEEGGLSLLVGFTYLCDAAYERMTQTAYSRDFRATNGVDDFHNHAVHVVGRLGIEVSKRAKRHATRKRGLESPEYVSVMRHVAASASGTTRRDALGRKRRKRLA